MSGPLLAEGSPHKGYSMTHAHFLPTQNNLEKQDHMAPHLTFSPAKQLPMTPETRG